MKRRARKSVLKAAWIGKKGGGSEQRWRITDGQDRSGWKKVKGIGNVVLNTRKLHWISESKMMNTRNSYYNKRKKMDKLDEKLGEANWTETAGEANWARITDGQAGQVARSCVQ